jgi:uncharacterized protein (DUF849 family)
MAKDSGEKVLRKVIYTAAVTGAAATPTMSEYLPLTPKQIADDAVRSYEAGAAIAHVHARNPENGEPTANLDIFREILSDIKSRTDMVICVTTGGAGTEQQRIAPIAEFKPELATLNCGSTSGNNVPVWEKIRPCKYEWEDQRLSDDSFVFTNTYKMMREYAQIMKDADTKPELEIWDLGQVGAVAFLISRGYVKTPVHLQFVMGALSGMPAKPGTLVHVLEHTKSLIKDFTWSVAAIGRDQYYMAATSMALGGQVRVGLEDNLYAAYGKLAKSSAEQVERVVTIGRQFSMEPATPAEAREMLGLKGLDKVNF